MPHVDAGAKFGDVASHLGVQFDFALLHQDQDTRQSCHHLGQGCCIKHGVLRHRFLGWNERTLAFDQRHLLFTALKPEHGAWRISFGHGFVDDFPDGIEIISSSKAAKQKTKDAKSKIHRL